MKGYKAFNKGLKCRNYQFEYKVFEEEKAEICDSGDYSQVALKGNNSVGANIGIGGTIKGALGCWITLAEYDEDYKPICVRSAKIDGAELKPDTMYKLENGEFVEVLGK